MYRLHRMLLDAQGGEGGSSTSTTPPAPKVDPEVSFQRQLDKRNGDGISLARKLFSENFKLRHERDELRGKVPGDGSRLFTSEQAKKIDKILDGRTLDDVVQMVKDYPTIEAEVKKTKRDRTLSEFAKKAGVDVTDTDKVDVLAQFTPADVTFEEKTEKVDGKDVVRIVVKAPDKDPVDFDAFYRAILPALKPVAEAASPARSQTPSRTPVVPQPRADGQATPTNPVDRAQAEMIRGEMYSLGI